MFQLQLPVSMLQFVFLIIIITFCLFGPVAAHTQISQMKSILRVHDSLLTHQDSSKQTPFTCAIQTPKQNLWLWQTLNSARLLPETGPQHGDKNQRLSFCNRLKKEKKGIMSTLVLLWSSALTRTYFSLWLSQHKVTWGCINIFSLWVGWKLKGIFHESPSEARLAKLN